MESINKISRRNCSVQTRAAGTRCTKGDRKESLTNLSRIPQLVTATNFPHDTSNKKLFNQISKTVSYCNGFQNNAQNEMIFMNDGAISFCSYHKTLDEDLSNNVVQVLQHTLQDLELEFISEKNINQILKKDILVAKKVVEKEIAANSEDFETLLVKGNSKSWKGRQEIILALKRKFRHLNEIIVCLDNRNVNGFHRKKLEPKTGEVTKISDRQIDLCSELERQKVWRNVERYKQNFIVSRDLMKNSLDRLIDRNGKLKEEARTIRQKLSLTPKQIDEEMIQLFLDIRNQLKTKVEEKSYMRRKINFLEHEISRNNIIKKELTNAIVTQKCVLSEREEKMKSLNDEKAKLQAMLDSTRKKRNEEAAIRKKKFQGVEKKYEKVVKTSENVIEQLTDSNQRLEMRRKLQLEKSPVIFIRKSLLAYPTKILKDQLESHRRRNQLESSIETPGDRIFMYKKKLLLYKLIFCELSKRNQDKMKTAIDLIKGTKEWTFKMVENRCRMLQLESEIKTLKNQSKKLKNSVLNSNTLKYVKKKGPSSTQMMENMLNEKKMYLAIKNKENDCLKSLIMHLLASKRDDCNLFGSYLIKNNDVFLKELSEMKLLNAPRK